MKEPQNNINTRDMHPSAEEFSTDVLIGKQLSMDASNTSSSSPSKSSLPSYFNFAHFKNPSIFGETSQYSVRHLFEREISGKPKPKMDIFEQSTHNSLYQRDLRAHTGCVNAVDFSPTEEWIVSGGDDLKVRIWKTIDCCTHEKPSSTSAVMKAIHHSNIFSLRFSHKTERIYSAGNDHRLLVHEIRTAERLRSYRASSSIYYIATHPSDDNMIAAASEDRNVYLFDLRGNEGDGLCTKLRQEGTAYSVVWNPQNHNLVAVCNGKTGLLVYDLRMSNNAYIEAGKMTKKAICADWSPCGEILFCAISRSNPICFNIKNSEYAQLMDPKYSNMCTIKSCSFAGEKYMVTGSDDWNIYVWKVPSSWGENAYIEKAHTVLNGHRSIVNHVKYGVQSNLLLSCGVEKIVKCWSGLPLRNSYHEPKMRERLSALPASLRFPDHGSMDSDTDEDIETLQRFDFYYETMRARARIAPGDASDETSDDSDMDVFMLADNDSDEDGIDQESFFSEITSGLQSPSPAHSPSPQTSDSPIEAKRRKE